MAVCSASRAKLASSRVLRLCHVVLTYSNLPGFSPRFGGYKEKVILFCVSQQSLKVYAMLRGNHQKKKIMGRECKLERTLQDFLGVSQRISLFLRPHFVVVGDSMQDQRNTQSSVYHLAKQLCLCKGQTFIIFVFTKCDEHCEHDTCARMVGYASSQRGVLAQCQVCIQKFTLILHVGFHHPFGLNCTHIRGLGLYYLWTYKTHLAAILLVASFPVLHLVITLSTANHGRATCLKLSSRTLKTWLLVGGVATYCGKSLTPCYQ